MATQPKRSSGTISPSCSLLVNPTMRLPSGNASAPAAPQGRIHRRNRAQNCPPARQAGMSDRLRTHCGRVASELRRTLHGLIYTCIGIGGVSKMQPLQPEQATFLLQMALPALKNEHRVTRKIIEAVPAEQGDYRPDGVSKSALELAWHLASAENFFMDGVAAGQFNYVGGSRPD